MLDPRDRRLLLDSLRPPDGHRLDFAVATTYSLDLVALLTVPLAFTFFDWENVDGEPTADPVALLEAARRYADRVAVFVQAGEIKVPPPAQRLVAYLERSIFAVRAPHPAGVFHPKVWALRFTADGQPARHRVLCLSRNLTFDRSWDQVLVLDGELQERRNAIAANHPLARLIEALPSLVRGDVPDSTRTRVNMLADELRRVRFELPEDIDDVAFWPMGLPGHRPPDIGAGAPVLVVSPFLSDTALSELRGDARRAVLVSRADELATVSPGELAQWTEVYALDPAAEDGLRDDEGDGGLSGLHAKLYVQEAGWDAIAFMGSANATDAAFSRNVEFLAQLTGKKSRVGIDAILNGTDGDGGLARLLVPWRADSSEPSPEAARREALENALTRAKRALAVQPLRWVARPADGDRFLLDLELPEMPSELANLEALAWPTTLRAEAAQPLATPGLTFGPFESGSLTSFLACELTTSDDTITVSCRFVMNLPLTGAPADRFDRLLAAQIGDREQLMRLLWLLLQEAVTAQALEQAMCVDEDASQHAPARATAPALFEHLVKCVATAPARVRDVGRLLEDLSRTSEGRALIPEGLPELWQAITASEESDGAAA